MVCPGKSKSWGKTTGLGESMENAAAALKRHQLTDYSSPVVGSFKRSIKERPSRTRLGPYMIYRYN